MLHTRTSLDLSETDQDEENKVGTGLPQKLAKKAEERSKERQTKKLENRPIFKKLK